MRESSLALTAPYYTVQQVMSYLQVSDETVYRYIRSGKLKAVRSGGLWRVSREALEEFLGKGSTDVTNQ